MEAPIGSGDLAGMATNDDILARLLTEAGILTDSAYRSARREQRRSQGSLAEALVRSGVVSEEQIARQLAEHLGLSFLAPPLNPAPDALKRVDPALARAKGVLPLGVDGRFLRVALADPLDSGLIEDLAFQSGCHVEAVVAPSSAVRRKIRECYRHDRPEFDKSEFDNGIDRKRAVTGLGKPTTLEAEAAAAPIVQIVDRIIARAIGDRASDIHIEPMPHGSRVRMRIDGRLARAGELPADAHAAAISRVKIMAGLDISVRRRPQDGGFTVQRGERPLTIRVSTLPAQDGEKAVLRLLDPGEAPPDLSSLGLSSQDLDRVRQILERRQGVLIAAGPTGSGKTTTLSGAVAELLASEINIVTLEDPVEYRFPGVAQVQIDRRAGVDFPSGLRAILRQDPDVILVGEIRDRETAEIAMSAAVTGHLVLSTIHTVDAPSAVVRLVEMGVPPFLVAGGLAGVVAQRLVRRLCSRCWGRGGSDCPSCKDGYRGRSGVFEVLLVVDEIRTAISAGAPIAKVRTLARRNGMGSMARDALRQVAQGITTPHEAGAVMALSRGSAARCGHCNTELPPAAAGCPMCGRTRFNLCACGKTLDKGWRYCPSCLRGATPMN